MISTRAFRVSQAPEEALRPIVVSLRSLPTLEPSLQCLFTERAVIPGTTAPAKSSKWLYAERMTFRAYPKLFSKALICLPLSVMTKVKRSYAHLS